MDILVCIKQVPGTSKVEVDPVTGVLKRGGVDSKMNPYDLYALETALKIKESKGGIVIEDDVWIGANCVLLDGATLRQGCVIGAGSIVRGEIKPYSINVGTPLTVMGWRK